MSTAAVGPILKIAKPREQHMLLLFVPLTKPKADAPAHQGVDSFQDLFTNVSQPDPRAFTGVHFSMFYLMKEGEPSRIAVPTFVPAKGKNLLVALAIYDGDFEPYIGAFLTDPKTVVGLNALLAFMDESGIIEPTDPTSAQFILAHGGVQQNSVAFYQLLMRYNFADPTIPAIGPGGMQNPPAKLPYLLGATFPGLSVGMFLKPEGGYPNAHQLWPAPGTATAIYYEPSVPPPLPTPPATA